MLAAGLHYSSLLCASSAYSASPRYPFLSPLALLRQACGCFSASSLLPYFLTSLLPYFLTSLLPYFLTSLLPYFLTSLLPCFLASLLPYLLTSPLFCLCYHRVYTRHAGFFA